MGNTFILDDLNNLRNGYKTSHQVAEFPQTVLDRLSWKSSIIYLSKESLHHINSDHPDIDDFVLLLLPKMIRNGLIVQEAKKPNIVVVIYQIDETKRISVILKRARNGFDIWVSSIHRMKKRQTASILKRGFVIQNHK